jgi:hypothetical protein
MHQLPAKALLGHHTRFEAAPPTQESDLFKEASELGRAQAIQLNSALEDAGL